MRVKILLEKKLRLLDIQYDEFCRIKFMADDELKCSQIENEIKKIEESKLYLERLIYSLTWENWINEKETETENKRAII